MKVFDYYSRFEGEPEIRIVQRSKNGKNIAILRLWVAYFDVIIDLIEPNDKGCWEGVALHYHLATGWNDTNSWKCDDIPLFLKQLESIDENRIKNNKAESLERVSHDALKTLKSILKKTIEAKEEITIESH